MITYILFCTPTQNFDNLATLQVTSKMADLIAAFERAGIAQARKPLFHNMRMSFPVRDIIPSDATPYLKPPKHVEFREKPRRNTYLLLKPSLDFDHRFAAKTAIFSAAQIDRPSFWIVPNQLVKLVDGLQDIAGESELAMVSYKRHYDFDVIYGLRLRTIFQSGEKMEWNFHYSVDQFETFYDLADEREWLTLMLSIIDRESDRAFLHVQRNIEAADPQFAESQEASLARRWNRKRVPSATELLMRKLQHVHDHVVTLLSELDRENWTSHPRESLCVLLPCGHEDHISYKQSIALTVEQCLHSKCADCGKYVLTEHDAAILAIAAEKQIRKAFQRDSVYWETFDEDFRNPNLQLHIKTSQVSKALVEALESLRAPESATPAAISLIDIPETVVVMASLREMLQVSAVEFVASAEEISDRMGLLTIKAIAQYAGGDDWMATRLPEEYSMFLGRWMNRAVHQVVKVSTPAPKGSVDEVALLMGNAKMDES